MIQKLLSDRPILFGGLGLTAGLGLVGGFTDIFANGTTLASLIATGVGLWWWRRQGSSAEVSNLRPAMPVPRESVETALAALKDTLGVLRQEATELNSHNGLALAANLEDRHSTLLRELDRDTLVIGVTGTARTGKTHLVNHLQNASPLDAGQLSFSEIRLISDRPHSEVLTALTQRHDGVVYLITEDLTESALTDLKILAAAGQRVLLALNKQDNYLPDDRALLVERLASRIRPFSPAIDMVAIATAPKPIKVRTYDSAGQIQERLEPQTEEIEPIVDILQTWMEQERVHLVAQTVMRQTHQLRQEIQLVLNQVRHEKATPLIERLQWTAAATTFANPVPSLDLLAAAAITGQLIMDLGRVYHQPLALDQAKTVAQELAAVVAQLGLVELSTQLLSTALKSHAATYVVGGSVQALSAAYLTRLCGESLMAYFEERALTGQADTAISVETIGHKIQTILPTTQRTEFLRQLVIQGLQKLTPPPPPTLPAGQTAAVHLSVAGPEGAEMAPETIEMHDLFEK